MDLSWHVSNSKLQAKTHYHTEKQGFFYLWLLKIIPDTPTEVKPSFRKVSQHTTKLRMLFNAHLWVREFGHKSTPSDRPWIEAYCPKF